MKPATLWIESQAAKCLAAARRMSLPLLAAITFVVGVTLVIGFCIALLGSESGEVASALGSLIGGMVGAGGAVWAVFLTLSRQREEEMAKVSSAVRTEVTAFVKYIIGALHVCQEISKGTVKIPRQDARYIVKNLLSGPVVYPAVADRVGLLPHPHATTEFYMRLSEAQSMVEVLRTRTDTPGITYVTPPAQYVTAEFAASIADSLITALQLARAIVDDDGDTSGTGGQLAAMVRTRVVGHIDECVRSAKESFPDAESFKE